MSLRVQDSLKPISSASPLPQKSQRMDVFTVSSFSKSEPIDDPFKNFTKVQEVDSDVDSDVELTTEEYEKQLQSAVDEVQRYEVKSLDELEDVLEFVSDAYDLHIEQLRIFLTPVRLEDHFTND